MHIAQMHLVMHKTKLTQGTPSFFIHKIRTRQLRSSNALQPLELEHWPPTEQRFCRDGKSFFARLGKKGFQFRRLLAQLP